ncbi:MAG: hypothetical protein JWM52_785 [Candidatus Saccharibacteria bacterium]|nr:hypothetical protein [Candidatus Saccharibacteria bacterium]
MLAKYLPRCYYEGMYSELEGNTQPTERIPTFNDMGEIGEALGALRAMVFDHFGHDVQQMANWWAADNDYLGGMSPEVALSRAPDRLVKAVYYLTKPHLFR